MRNQILEWLRKVARWLETAGVALSTLSALIDSLILALGGRDFGFGAA
jgi:hypothetical protein